MPRRPDSARLSTARSPEKRKKKEITLTKTEALKLMDWHGGGGSSVYALASTSFAGKPSTPETARRALYELESDLRGGTASTPADRRNLESRITRIRASLTRIGALEEPDA